MPSSSTGGKLGKSMLPKWGTRTRGLKQTGSGRSAKLRKPTVFQRVGKRISASTIKFKNKVSTSAFGKTYRAVVKVVKFVASVVKGVAKAVVKTAKAAWKATKFMARTFYRGA